MCHVLYDVVACTVSLLYFLDNLAFAAEPIALGMHARDVQVFGNRLIWLQQDVIGIDESLLNVFTKVWRLLDENELGPSLARGIQVINL